MARILPPLNPLRVFEVAARHQHFTHAAKELGITQAAVSRQIMVLENWLNVKLFERRHNELHLTVSGAEYLTTLGEAFDLIESSTAAARLHPQKTVIVLRALATFSMLWLIPRLPRFRATHPDILIDIKTAVTPIKFRPEETGLIIHYGKPDNFGFQADEVVSQRIFSDIIVPVCHPDLLRNGGQPEDPADLCRYHLLHSRRRLTDWANWFESVGIDPPLDNGSVFDNSSLTYQAAREGIGVAMGQTHLLETELNSGELVIPIDRRLERGHGYFLTYPKRVRRDPKVIAFKEWIIYEASPELVETR